jgi:hypothetical protein
MKKYLCAALFVVFLGCSNADENGESSPATDTVVIDTDSVKNSKLDGTSIDAAVLDTTIR